MISSSDIVSLMQKIAGRFGYTIKRPRPGIRRAGSTGEIRVTVGDLLHAIHGHDIYEDFNHQAYAEDLAG